MATRFQEALDAARTSAKSLTHTLTRFSHAAKHAAVARCIRCGRTVQVSKHWHRGGHAIVGPAIRENCFPER